MGWRRETLLLSICGDITVIVYVRFHHFGGHLGSLPWHSIISHIASFEFMARIQHPPVNNSSTLYFYHCLAVFKSKCFEAQRPCREQDILKSPINSR